MILRRTYAVEHWASWDHEINAAAEDFRRRFAIWPNILLASDVTLGWFDQLAARAKLRREEDGRRPEPTEHAPMGSFCGADYEVELCLRPDLPLAAFILIYDDDPEGEEAVPEEDTVDAMDEEFGSAAGVK